MRLAMRQTVLALVAVLAMSSSARAQKESPIELGLDAAFSYGMDSPHVTTVSIPIQRLRVGFFVSPTVSIEPAFGLSHSSESGDSFTQFDVGAGALFHFNSSRSEMQPYVRPFVDVVHTTVGFVGGSGGFTATSLGAGVGTKIPIANRFAWRLEAALARTLEHDNVKAANQLSAFVGFSFFTH